VTISITRLESKMTVIIMTLKTFSIMTSTKQQNDIMTISIVTFVSVMISVMMKLRIMTPCKTTLIIIKEIQHTPKLQSALSLL
jgi:hypothetical protein